MSIIGSNILAGASGSGVSAYEIEQSLRFNSADSAYLNRTPASAGNRKTWTWSGWVKRCAFGSVDNCLFSAYGNGTQSAGIYFSNDVQNDSLEIRFGPYSGGWQGFLVTAQVFRDSSAWYHIVFAADTTQATSSDRLKIYINGSQVTTFNSSAYPSQNADGFVNQAQEHQIGRLQGSTYYHNGYLAEVNFIDGTALDPSSFGEPDDNGVWRPIEYTGSHGTNGFYLKFESSGIGTDSSGNGNNFSPTGFSTSGTGTDVMSDTPTTNWATLNPIDNFNGRWSNDPTNGNLEISIPSDSSLKRNYPGAYSTIEVSTTGKFYFEITPSQQYTSIGVVGTDYIQTVTSGDHIGDASQDSVEYRCSSGDYRWNGSTSASGLGGFTSGNVYGVAVDLGNETFRVYENGIAGSELSISGWTGNGARVSAWVSGSTESGTITYNFGQREFANPPGTIGATDYFNTVTWTGNGSSTSREITGCGFQPDLVWIKGRSVDGSGQRLQDVVRGAGTVLQANSQNQEFDDSSNLGAFTSDGFTLTTTGSSYNQSSATYVAWCWKAGGTAVSNTDGTLTSSVSANQDAGFSIVTWGGSTADGTVGHGLGVAPSLIIFKRRNATTSWPVYHSAISPSNVVYLNETAAQASSGNSFGSTPTAPTNTVFSVGDKGDINYGDMLAYCFAEKTGISKFGEYTGNGSSDGPVISCGFRPAMVIIKWYESVNTSESWHLYDNKRGGNPNNTILVPDATADEESPADRYIQFTSDGFQLKSSGQAINRSGAKYIFMAWAATFTGSDDFKSLNTANLPEPDIKDGGAHFNTVLYTGNNLEQVITGVNFQPDWVWVKCRNQGSTNHVLQDAVRGAQKYLTSDTTVIEGTSNGTIISFDSDGFTIGAGNPAVPVNNNGDTFVAWNWKANGSGSSNTDGSITSTVSANPSAGFSIVTYSGQTTNFTWGHGLGVPPSMVIIKRRNTAAGWSVYHKSLGATKRLQLDQTGGEETMSYFQNAEPTDTVFSVTTNGGVGADGDTYVAYCFAEVEGYSKFGSYTGNGSADGPFVYCGFKPAWVMVKRSNGGAEPG
jgi:hypothetical protein